MSTIVTRLAKGSSLSYQELDDNFSNLNTDKLELSDLSVTDSGGDGSLTYNNVTGVFTYTGPSASDVRAHISGGTGITVTDGVIATTITQYADSNARSAISVTDSGGDGALAYNSSTGVITYTGPSAADVRAHISAGTGISITDGVIANTQTAGIADVVEDTTPQLGGNLDLNGNSIVDNANGTVNINGFAYGGSIASVQSGTVTAIQAQDRLTLNDTGTNLGLANDDTLRFSGTSAIQYSGGAEIEDGVVYYISFPFGTGFGHISVFTHPVGDPNRVQVAAFMSGTGALSGVTWEEVSVITPSTGNVLTWDGSKFLPGAPTAGLSDVVADTTPQLGGSLDVNGNSIVSVSNGNITLAPNGTGKVIANNLNYRETVHSLGTTSGTIAPNVTNGNVQSITLNGNITFNGFTSPVAGQSVTLIINTGGTNRTLTSTMKFANADKTLSTTNTTDIISVYYDGTNYWASLSKGFA
jgi:hypothetical protein